MNLNHLFYFRILAQTENYTEASKQIMISQPSLSYAIKKLESDLDVPLFKKVGRNVQLTTYGKELHQMTEDIFSLVNKTTESIQKKRKVELNSLSIGIIPTLASNFLPEVIQKGRSSGTFTQDCHIFHGFTTDILDKIRSGTYDLGICSKIDYPELTFIPIEKQPFVLLVNEELFNKEPDLKENWFNMPLVTYRDNVPIGISARKIIVRYTEKPNIVEEFDDEITIGGFVSTNPTLALVAKTSLLKQFDLMSIPLDKDKFYHTVYLSYLTENEKWQTINDFRNLIETSSKFNTTK